ncbi:dienelactone hydrolase family protein [Solicola sp. PLA-1-18]|uniref:dienelactone hydrolase family protein n=1 Tax=Solicola sp. PLA-1-18 TaxID=3380532 RepID=UPI003B7AE3A7
MSTDAGTQVEIETPDGPMPAYRWLPPSGTGPGLVLVQEIFGVSDYIRSRAADLAALGYVVLAPEIYWRLERTTVDESRDDVLQQAMGLVQQLDWDVAVQDGAAALDHLRADEAVTGGTGLLGFCFGGGLAFAVAAERDPDVLVSYYGSALPDLLHLAPQVTAPSLHHVGTSDAYLGPEVVERIRAAVERPGVRFETYEGADHAFDNPMPAFHHADASARAWATTAEFLAEHLPTT